LCAELPRNYQSLIILITNMWKDLVNTGVLEIMSYLPYYDIVAAGQVCRQWNGLSKDELLWKAVLTRHFHLAPPVTLRSGAESWRKEFIRMMDEVPSVVTDHPEHHVQEARLATHVSFAHTMEMFSVCYGKKGVVIWRATHPLTRVSVIESLGWEAQSSRFNSSDTLLLVSGELHADDDLDDWGHWDSVGKIAIFQNGGTMNPDQFSLVKLVNACTANPNYGPAYEPPFNNFSSGNPSYGWVTDRTFLTYTWGAWNELGVYLNSTDPLNNDHTLLYNITNDSYMDNLGSFCVIRTPQDHSPTLLFPFGKGELYREGQDLDMSQPWGAAHTKMGLVSKLEENPNKFAFHTNDPDVRTFTPMDENFEHMLIAGFCLSPDQKMCYVNARPLTRNVEMENDPDYELPMPFKTNEDLQLFPLDLSTMTTGPPLTGHKGFVNNWSVDWSVCNKLFPEVTRDYVSCCSEDGHGYLWDRHYGCLVSVLPGSGSLLGNQVEDSSLGNRVACSSLGNHVAGSLLGNHVAPQPWEPPVVSVAMDPVRQNVMVTIGLQGRIKVFRSKKWIRENVLIKN